LEAFR
ncbi:hypothetical protein D030_3083B, partial [Vibrio parahaemolyticus AQ3810]